MEKIYAKLFIVACDKCWYSDEYAFVVSPKKDKPFAQLQFAKKTKKTVMC